MCCQHYNYFPFKNTHFLSCIFYHSSIHPFIHSLLHSYHTSFKKNLNLNILVCFIYQHVLSAHVSLLFLSNAVSYYCRKNLSKSIKLILILYYFLKVDISFYYSLNQNFFNPKANMVFCVLIFSKIHQALRNIMKSKSCI